MAKRMSRPDLVRHLSKTWTNYYKKNKYLKAIDIYDATPLRGVKNSRVNFEFPVSVICGANGSGKTTFLTLAILGFHAEKAPFVPLRNINYFDFNYFYRSAYHDKHIQGIQIGWEYTDGCSDRIEKGQQRWLRYIKNSGEPRRPVRGTEFIGISRITPAFEKKNYHSYFANKAYFEEEDHDKLLSSFLGQIMSKPYASMSELTYLNSAGTHAVQNYNKTHSSFNAGAGEECLSHILRTLLQCPKGSIVAIEEIEIGLHPSTLPKLVDVILELANDRKLQVIITSHSTEFLRAFPKEGLILAERQNDRIEFSNQPNVEYAIRRLGGAHKPAASIICEDPVAAELISSALPAKLRSICPIIGFGGKDQLIEKAETIKKYSPSAKIVIAWDGEIPDSYLEDAKSKCFVGCKLPGGLEPENYLISKLRTTQGISHLKKQYDLEDQEVISLIQALDTLSDPHDLGFVLSEHLGFTGGEDALIKNIAQFVTREYFSEFNELITTIKNITL